MSNAEFVSGLVVLGSIKVPIPILVPAAVGLRARIGFN
jgi:hypothetical protein